jgi:hypothetical protein
MKGKKSKKTLDNILGDMLTKTLNEYSFIYGPKEDRQRSLDWIRETGIMGKLRRRGPGSNGGG